MEKIKRYLKRIWWAINPFNGATWIDRIMPPGSKKRIEYDKEQTEKRYKEKVENYYKFSDSETAEYWKGIDHRLFLKYKDSLEKELTDYEKWLQKNSLTDKEVIEEEKKKFFLGPKISIVVPLYNTNIDFFRELLYSVHCQKYKNWELCLADGSPKPIEEIKQMVLNDNRIKYKFLGENKGIAENTNEAIKMATGNYIAFLDHDDLLEINALFEVVKNIKKYKADFLYTDEDKFHFIDEPYFEPFFKPDFAIDTLRSNNYICHFTVIKKKLLDKVGYLQSEYNGAQDYDLILRATSKARKIIHIAKILYHWRLHNSSTSKSLETKPYVYEAGKRAIEKSLEQNGLQGTVNVDLKYGTYCVNYDILGTPSVAVITNNKDFNTSYSNCNIYEEGTSIKNLNEDYVVFLSNNCKVITDNWIEKMLGFCQRDDVGAVGGKIYKDGKIYNAGYILSPKTGVIEIFKGISKDENLYFSRTNIIQNLNAVSGKCMMIKRKLISEFTTDIDTCLQLRSKNYKVVFNPYIECEYNGQDIDITDEKRNEFIKKWLSKLNDEYYNENLSLDSNIYELKG